MPQDLSPSRPQPHSSKQPPLLFGPAKKSSGAGAPRVSWVGCNFSSFQRITWRHHRAKTGDGCRVSGYKACNNPRSVYISPIILAIYKHLQWKMQLEGDENQQKCERKPTGFFPRKWSEDGRRFLDVLWTSRSWHDLSQWVDFFSSNLLVYRKDFWSIQIDLWYIFLWLNRTVKTQLEACVLRAQRALKSSCLTAILS